MSMLLGPLSETISKVSARDCALAGDQTAGAAGSTLPAASAVIDFRNSRRFIETSGNVCGEVPQRSCQNREARPVRSKQLIANLNHQTAAFRRGLISLSRSAYNSLSRAQTIGSHAAAYRDFSADRRRTKLDRPRSKVRHLHNN